MKRAAIVLILSMIFLQNVFSEVVKPKKHRIGVDLGFSYLKINDELESPLAYKGTGIPIGLFYCCRGVKNRHDIFLGFTKCSLSPGKDLSFGRHSVENYRFVLEYRYHRLLTRMFGKSGRLFLGGGWNNYCSIRKHFYSDFSNEWFGDIVTTLDFSAMFEIKIKGESRIIDLFSIPIISFVIRPGYSGMFPLSTELTSIHRFVRFKNRLGFEHPLSPHFDIRIIYEFVYYQYPEPKQVKSGMDHISVGIMYKFGGR